jgi:hypothetical protein
VVFSMPEIPDMAPPVLRVGEEDAGKDGAV